MSCPTVTTDPLTDHLTVSCSAPEQTTLAEGLSLDATITNDNKLDVVVELDLRANSTSMADVSETIPAEGEAEITADIEFDELGDYDIDLVVTDASVA